MTRRFSCDYPTRSNALLAEQGYPTETLVTKVSLDLQICAGLLPEKQWISTKIQNILRRLAGKYRDKQ